MHSPFLQPNKALEKCMDLMQIDYSLITVSNANAELSLRYPSLILIPQYELAHNSNGSGTIYENKPDDHKLKNLREQFKKANFARY